jgi:putative ABC transport system substrate-binding protein
MQRRQFLGILGGSAVAWSLTARAQQPAMPVVGFLSSNSPAALEQIYAATRQGLKETGYIEGQNVAFEYRWAEGQYSRFPALAADLVQRHIAVIVAPSIPAALAAKAATATTPIVFQIAGDPVQYGLVASLSRPGGNITGVARLAVTLGPKRLEFLRQLVPAASLIGLLVNPNNPESKADIEDIRTAALATGSQIAVLQASNERDFENIFAMLVARQAGGLLIEPDAFISGQRNRLVTLAARHAIPTIYDRREYVAAGGLISYGNERLEPYRQVGIYVGRILKGEKPANLPVQQPTKFELAINLKTAKALGLTVPPALLTSADEVIE